MRVKVTKAMAKAILTAAKKQAYTSIQDITVDALPPAEYERYIFDDAMQAADYGDFDSSTGLIKFMRIVYTDACYSVDRYLSTYELINAFKHSDKTYEGFMRSVLSAIEI